jgi:hypothetical protein
MVGRARVRKDWDDVANDRRAAVAELEAVVLAMRMLIDEAGNLIVALVCTAMLQWLEDGWSESAEKSRFEVLTFQQLTSANKGSNLKLGRSATPAIRPAA